MKWPILDQFTEFQKQWNINPEIRHHFKPQWVMLIIAEVILGFLIFVFGLIQKTEIDIHETERLTSEIQVVEKNFAENLKSASNVLGSIREMLPIWQRAESADAINHRLSQTLRLIPSFRTIFVLDKNGICIYSTRTELLGHDLSMREYFRTAKNSKQNHQTYISAPFYSPITKVSTIAIGQIIEDQNGQFNGMIGTALKPEFFVTMLDSVLYADDMWGAIVEQDGRVIIQRPERFQLPADKANVMRPNTFFYRHIMGGNDLSVMTGRWFVDNQFKLVALRNVTFEGFDGTIVVALARNLASMYVHWLSTAIVVGSLFILICLGAIFVLYKYQSDQLSNLIEKKRIINLLEEREHDLSSILDAVPSMISYWDADLKNRFSNRSFGKAVNQRPEIIIGKTFEQIFGNQFDQIKKYIDATLKGQSQIFERSQISDDGSTAYYSENFIPDYRKGRLLGFYSVSIDISDIRNAELKADQANLAKSQFLANMSHEIRTPMNAIIGFTELLKATELNAKQSGFLEKINTASKNLLHILNDILDYSKIESEKLVIEKTSFSIRDLINSTQDMFLMMADQKGLTFQIDIDEKIPKYLIGDPLRLGQVINNLVGNSIKFTEQGQITITLNCVELTESNCVLDFSITDTGIGIDEKVMDQIFKPFVQADSSIARKYGGNGLGLAISQKLIKAMGGEIYIDEKIKTGSRFYFRLTLPLVGGG